MDQDIKKIEEKIAFWTDRLMDLSKKNPLINCHIPSEGGELFCRSFFIDEPRASELWEKLNGEKLIALKLNGEKDDFTWEIRSEHEEIIDVSTNQNQSEALKILYYLTNTYRTYMENKGVNGLHLGFGFLHWEDRDSKNDVEIYAKNKDHLVSPFNKNEYHSPLLLVPVNIGQMRPRGAFELSLSDTKIRTNLALKLKLKNEWDFDLNEYNETDTFYDYFLKIQKAIQGFSKWSLTDNVVLSLFNVYKQDIYLDITKNIDKITNHEFIREIVFPKPDSYSNRDMEPNNSIIEFDSRFIVQADSSQQEAIQFAKLGHSFILQAPPGTGKSQTITNIISELLMQKKQILFVSEKQAAIIDVLDLIAGKRFDMNLEDYCLFLSNSDVKASQIIRNLNLEYIGDRNLHSDEYFLRNRDRDEYEIKKVQLVLELRIDEDLNCVRQKLNEYFYELHKIIPPLNKSIFFAYGKISSSFDIGKIDFTFQNSQNCTDLEYNKILETLKEFANFVDTYGYETINSLQNAVSSFEELYFLQIFKNNKADALEVAKDGINIYNEVSFLTGYKNEWNFKNIPEILKILKISLESVIICPDWLRSADRKATFDIFCKFFTIGQNDDVIKNIAEEIEQLNNLKLQVMEHKRILQLSYDYRFENLRLDRLEYETRFSSVFAEFDKDILNIDIKGVLERFKTNYNNFFKRIISREYKKDKERIVLFKKTPGSLNYLEIVNFLTELNYLNEMSEMIEGRDDIVKVVEKLIEEDVDQLNEYDSKLGEKTKQFNEMKSANDNEKQIFLETFGISFDDRLYVEGIKNELKPVLDLIEVGKTFNLSSIFLNDICNREETILSQTNSLLNKLKNWCERFENLLDISETTNATFLDSDFNKDKIFNITISELCQKIQNSLSIDDSLLQNDLYFNIMHKCYQLKISNFVSEIIKINLPSALILKSFEKCFFNNWVDAIIYKNDFLYGFTSEKYNENIQEFRTLEIMQKLFSKTLLYYNLEAQYHLEIFQSDKLNYENKLRYEKLKQNPNLSVSDIFQAIPTVINDIKPCIITSPILVSKFFKDTNYIFDTVIFDEASQIAIENAIPSIFRSKQVIIVGDDKQLPPSDLVTSNFFFESSDNVGENQKLSDFEQYNSILSEVSNLPKKSLTWHYRSKHENLIWFSNNYYYDEKLLTFPSPYNKEKDLGLEYVFVENGTYDSKEDGNIKEANKVADLVIDHIRNYSQKRSLGVIAFTETQQNAILHAIRQKLKDNEDILQIFWNIFQDHFFISNRYDGDDYRDRYKIPKYQFKKEFPPPDCFWGRFKHSFFIRNVETVQGDERDTIILSIGYAQDSMGKLDCRFGPINSKLGDHFLNVAITRAKVNLKLVTSISPERVDVSALNGNGLKHLIQYIDFAKNGPPAIFKGKSTNEEPKCDFQFEESVYNFLISKGYSVDKFVGLSRIKIDLAIRHPKKPGVFLCGILCDGFSYNSFKNVIDRDHLREAILEGLGWKIYKVWSVAWIKDPENEAIKLISYLEGLIQPEIQSEEGSLEGSFKQPGGEPVAFSSEGPQDRSQEDLSEELSEETAAESSDDSFLELEAESPEGPLEDSSRDSQDTPFTESPEYSQKEPAVGPAVVTPKDLEAKPVAEAAAGPHDGPPAGPHEGFVEDFLEDSSEGFPENSRAEPAEDSLGEFPDTPPAAHLEHLKAVSKQEALVNSQEKQTEDSQEDSKGIGEANLKLNESDDKKPQVSPLRSKSISGKDIDYEMLMIVQDSKEIDKEVLFKKVSQKFGYKRLSTSFKKRLQVSLNALLMANVLKKEKSGKIIKN
ncbi:MAG: DUF4011 domain-containing protein [Clostridiales Family XIII bacterium]|jgi:DNA polymerase III delta prime subunit|nr:DUF4011 domain-containing protein [Clostridiales Family XIII bacterium]